MAKKNSTPIAIAVGAAFLASASLSSVVSASENPFASQELTAGYNLAEKGAEGKCGEGKCGEGKCGGEKKAEKEGKCGEGKCGGEKKAEKEGKCGEGKCGEGKCGGKS
ncbi:MAG: hypothetical protein K6L75_02315 [Cellvibrionaceae bacterium]